MRMIAAILVATLLAQIARGEATGPTTPVLTKRRIRPSDCGTNGLFLQFVLGDGSNERQAPADTLTYFPNLKLTLYADMVLWEKASPELRKKLEGIVARHKAMLSELDKATANKPHARDGP